MYIGSYVEVLNLYSIETKIAIAILHLTCFVVLIIQPLL
jgi:hypothetical protein